MIVPLQDFQQPASSRTRPRGLKDNHLRFDDLGLHDSLLKNIQAEGFAQPTPIQARAIPPVLEGRDLLGLAQTGTGKTAAFALPVLHILGERQASSKHRNPRVLVLAPTRELVNQVADAVKTFSHGLGVRTTMIFGGVAQGRQVKALERGVDVIVATPGRLLDLMGQGHVRLDSVEVLVLDEADRMLDMGFIKPIRQIVSHLPRDRQNLLFSATMPKAMRDLARELLVNPVQVAVEPKVKTAPRIEQALYHVHQASKPDLLRQVIAAPDVERVIVFTRTKRGADRLATKLGRSSIDAAVIHGNKSQNARTRALDAFRKGKKRVLIATDVAARGIDVEQVSHVVNFDLPNEPESYVHRIGRTGRAGAAGVAVSFCDPSERIYLRSIEKLTKRAIPVNKDHPFASAAEAAPPSEEGAGSSPAKRRPNPSSRRRSTPGSSATRKRTEGSGPFNSPPRGRGSRGQSSADRNSSGRSTSARSGAKRSAAGHGSAGRRARSEAYRDSL